MNVCVCVYVYVCIERGRSLEKAYIQAVGLYKCVCVYICVCMYGERKKFGEGLHTSYRSI